MRSLVFVLASAAILLAATASAQPVIKAGEPFPTLVLPTMTDGSPASITDFRGTKVVLHIFASW